MKNRYNQDGVALIGLLILTTLAGILLAGALGMASSHIQTTKQQKDRLTDYMETEEAINKAVNWLRTNSSELLSFASKEYVYARIDLSDPTVGDNQEDVLSVPSRVFMNGTSQTPILTNSDDMAIATFPSGMTKDLVTDFAATDFGDKLVTVTLVNMLPLNPLEDYGDTDMGNPTPETNFYPIFRIDAMSGVNEGAHLHGYVVGSLVESTGLGFYGEDFVEMNQGCDSYESDVGLYSPASKKANCGVGSKGDIKIQQTEQVYGSIKTTGDIVTSSPYGGDVCADFSSGCPNAGEACEGTSCVVPGMPIYDSWATYCPTDKGNQTIAANTTVNIASDSSNDKCWNQMKVNNNKTLTLRSTDYAYFFKTFDIANNSTVNFSPNPATGVINLYVQKFVGDKFNGGQIFNMNNKPTQFKLHYLGTDALVLNGNADMNAFIVAPYAAVSVQGNFDFYGGIMAKSLTFTGSGNLHYDESGATEVLSDVAFRLRDLVQEYRLN